MERIDCGDEKWKDTSNSQEEEEEEEALSLCDLPVSLATEENQSKVEAANDKALEAEEEEDFDFGSWGGALFTESNMCAADEVFFQGQILPLRLSVSSDSGLARLQRDSRNTSRCNSTRSESMDYRCSGGFSSSTTTSRSSSSRSHHSSSSTSSNTTTAIAPPPKTTTKYKPRVRNQFQTHPSPKPQLRVSSFRHGNVGSRSRNSSMWEFFRLGLVRAPEIELQDLKLRTNSSNKTSKIFSSPNSNSNSSSGGGKSSCNAKNSCSNDGQNSNHGLTRKNRNRNHRSFTKDGAFFSGCKCSAGAVETVTSRVVIIKSNSICTGVGNDESATHVTKEKMQQLKKQKQPQHQQRQGKHAMSRHRTFEWLKELSLEPNLDEA